MKPTKAEFSSYVQFSTNVEDRLLNFHIDNAFYYVLKPKFGSLAEDILTTLETAGEPKANIIAFYNEFFKRLWILVAAKRFLTTHGANVTQFGLTQTRDPQGSFEPITPQMRAAMLKELERDISVTETNIYNELAAKNWTFDSVVYRKINRVSNSFGLNAI